jgi:hypothetical protein
VIGKGGLVIQFSKVDVNGAFVAENDLSESNLNRPLPTVTGDFL